MSIAPEPLWFTPLAPSPWRDVEIPAAYIEAALDEIRTTAARADDDPALPEHERVWRRLRGSAGILQELQTTDWPAMGGHELVAWILGGWAIATTMESIAQQVERLGGSSHAAEHIFVLAVYDAVHDEHGADLARERVYQAWLTVLGSPRAFREYETRALAGDDRAAAIASAVWLLAPPESHARSDVAESLMRRLGDRLDPAGLASLFIALTEQGETSRAWHLLALACDGQWAVALEDARRRLWRDEAWLPKSRDPERTATAAEPAPGDAAHPTYPEIPLTLPSAEELLDRVDPERRRLLEAYLAVNGNFSVLARQWDVSPQAVRQRFERLWPLLRRLFARPE